MNIPNLRFPGFSRDWEVKKLGEIFDVRDGTHESPSYHQTGKPLITSKNLLKDGTLDLENVSYISEIDFTNINKRSKVSSGDILFGMIGTIGNPVRVISNDFAIKNVALIKQKQMPTSYLIQYLRGPIINKQFYQNNSGGTQQFIALGDIRQLDIGVPDLDEQEKIARFLTVVDERVAATQQKVELLKQYKKGVMQKIFSQQISFKDKNGQNYPAWQEKKLGDLVSITTGRKDVNAGNPRGQYRFYTCAKDYTFSDEYSFEGEAIMIAGNAEVGLCQYFNGKFEAYQRTYVLQQFKQASGSFLFKYLSHFFRGYALGLKQTGAMSFIKIGMLTDFRVPVPSNEEQQKIADFLTSLDDKIKLEESKLEQAKHFKNSLLQRMFV